MQGWVDWYITGIGYSALNFVFGELLGKIGITLNIDHAEPKDRDSPDDIEACERAQQMKVGWFAGPIFGNGDYPDILKAQLAKMSKMLGLDRSPLPRFTEEEKRYNRGRLQFGWLCSRVVSLLDSSAEGSGFKSQPQSCWVTVLGKLFAPIVPLFTKLRNW